MQETLRVTLKKFPPLFFFIKWVCLTLGHYVAAYHWATLRRQPIIKLELGSGAKRGTDGWTTVDLRCADINDNLNHGIPLADNSVDAIYTSHMLEHIPYRELIALLEECYRVLKKGGYLSVCVPNAANYIRAYIEKREFEDKSRFYDKALIDTGSFLDQVNYMAYMNQDHCYMFDEENLVNTLKKAGFVNAKLRTFDPALDSTKFDYVSIYALAIK